MYQKSPEGILRRDRVVIWLGIIAVSVLAWSGSISRSRLVNGIPPYPQFWDLYNFSIAFGMWGMIVVAMMLPTATPAAVVLAGVNRQSRQRQRPLISTVFFLLGYSLTWIFFSAAAALMQGWLQGLLASYGRVSETGSFLSGMLLIAGGIYQLSPLKNVCLYHCRSPFDFIRKQWRGGIWGAAKMGVRHGIYCLGCWWLL